MRLRENIRRPGRYREEEVEELPPNPIFVVPTIEYNQNLRPAVFPTLNWDELPPDHPSVLNREMEEHEDHVEGVGEVSGEELSEEELSEEELSEEEFNLSEEETTDTAEPGMIQLPDGTWIATEEPGEYDGYSGSWNNQEVGVEQSIEEAPAHPPQKYWSDLTNGMRLVLMHELTYIMTFSDAVLYLCLDENELVEFIDLCVEEIKIRERSDRRVARIQQRRMDLIESGDFNVDGDEWGRIVDEEMQNDGGEMPATFLIKGEDIAITKEVLGSYKFREDFSGVLTEENAKTINSIPTLGSMMELQNRLEDYIGVDTMLKEIDFGEDFFHYLPGDAFAGEEVQDGLTDGTASSVWDVDDEPAPSAIDEYAQPPAATTAEETHPTKKAAKKDIERDGINVDLIKKPKKSRLSKKDRVTKKPVPPSRLREVVNADDLQTPRQSPTLSANQAPPNPTADDVQNSPEHNIDPELRSVQSLARSPFREHSPTTPPPPCAASFHNGLPPVQPTSSALPKAASTASPLIAAAELPASSLQSAPIAPVPNNVGPTAGLQPVVEIEPASSSQTSEIDDSVQPPTSDLSNPDPKSSSTVCSTPCLEPSPAALPDPAGTVQPSIIASPTAILQPSLDEQQSVQQPESLVAPMTQAPQMTPDIQQSPLAPSGGETAAGSPSQSSEPNAPTKIEAKVNGSQPSSLTNQSQSQSASSENGPGKRPRDEEVGSDIPADHHSKKPRLESQDEVLQSLVSSIVGNARALGNKMNSIKESAEAVVKPGVVSDSNAAAAASGGTDDHSQKLESADQIKPSDSVNTSEEPHTSTKCSPSSNSPIEPKKSSSSKREAAKAAGQTLLQDVAAQTTEANGESKDLGDVPPTVDKKTRPTARHPGTNKLPCIDSAGDDQSVLLCSETDAIETILFPSKFTIEVQIPAKKRAASELLPDTFEIEGSRTKKRMTGRTPSPVASLANETALARLTPLKGRDGRFVSPKKSPKKRSTFGFRPISEDEESSSSHAHPASPTKTTAGVQKKAASKKAADKANSTPDPEAASHDGESSSVIDDSACMTEPTTQSKKGSRKNTTTTKAATAKTAAAQPKPAPKPKVTPQSKTPVQTKYTKATAAAKSKAPQKTKAANKKGTKPSGGQKKQKLDTDDDDEDELAEDA